MADNMKYTEDELVKKLKTRSQEGFNYLYDNYSGALYSHILTLISDTDFAADVLQEAFVKIWKQMENYDVQKGRLYTWMLQIARNCAIDVLRSKRFQTQKQILNLSESVDVVATSDFDPDRIGIRQHVGQMKPEHRELIELSYFQGYTQEEMSEMLNLPLGTVKTRMRSALIQLRKYFRK